MQVDRKALLEKLQTSMIGAERGEFQNNSFSFKEGYVHAFKDFVAVSIFLGETFKFLKGSIRAAEFYSLLTKYTEDTVDIEVTEAGVDIMCGRSKATFAYQEDAVLKQVEKMDMEALSWEPVSEDFRAALNFCLLGLREYALEGVRVKDKTVLSVDSKRLNFFVMKDPMGDFLIEEKVVTELLKFDNMTAVAHSQTRLFLKLPDGTIVSGRKKMDTDYPFDKILSTVVAMEKVEEDPQGVLPSSFKQMIGRANVLSIEYGGMELLKITFSKEGIECESQRAIGKYFEKIEWKDPPKGMDTPIQVTLESSSTVYALERSKEIYLKEYQGFRRLVFVGPNSKCFLAAYTIEDTK